MLITPKNYKWHDVEHTLSWDIKEAKLNLQQEFIKYFAWSQFIKSRHYAYLSIWEDFPSSRLNHYSSTKIYVLSLLVSEI